MQYILGYRGRYLEARVFFSPSLGSSLSAMPKILQFAWLVLRSKDS